MSAEQILTNKTIEKHHVDKKKYPKLIVPTERREHQKIHNILPNDTILSRTMRQYDALTRLIVSMKNWRTAFEKDFGESPDMGLVNIEQRKKQIMKQIENTVRPDRQRTKHIKGFGNRYLAGILAYAHPNKFSSLRKFLFYCGYTQASRKLKRYNRKIKPIVHELVRHVIMCKDEQYYPFYLKVKEDLRQRHPERCKKGIDEMARNRIGTYLLKEVYELFRVENREVIRDSSTS